MIGEVLGERDSASIRPGADNQTVGTRICASAKGDHKTVIVRPEELSGQVP